MIRCQARRGRREGHTEELYGVSAENLITWWQITQFISVFQIQPVSVTGRHPKCCQNLSQLFLVLCDSWKWMKCRPTVVYLFKILCNWCWYQTSQCLLYKGVFCLPINQIEGKITRKDPYVIFLIFWFFDHRYDFFIIFLSDLTLKSDYWYWIWYLCDSN